jgi:hypothetical protein
MVSKARNGVVVSIKMKMDHIHKPAPKDTGVDGMEGNPGWEPPRCSKFELLEEYLAKGLPISPNGMTTTET